jgi:lysyl-tRNA synthetase class 2
MDDILLKTIEQELGSETNQFRQARLEKLKHIVSMGINPYPSTFEASSTLGEIQDRYSPLEPGEETQDRVKVCGRIRSLRNSGMFIDLQDPQDKLQVFCHKTHLNEDDQKLLLCLDLGDFIGVEGTMRRTPRGEITLNAQNIMLLSKSLLPPPEKYHGLQDVETRLRQRYLDLLATPQTRETLRHRSQIIMAMRQHLAQWGFLEVETPMLHGIAGGAAAKPFTTYHNALGLDLFLRISPELYLKRLMVGGLSDKIFEINRNFRNEGLSTRHNPEFTMIELYQAYIGYDQVMDLTEKLIEAVALTVFGTTEFTFGDHSISFKSPWPRISMAQLVLDTTGVDFLKLSQEEALREARRLGVEMSSQALWGQALERVFAEKVEHTLIQPTHVTEHPIDISPLAKKHPQDGRLTERFESFVCRMELANGFSELSDPIDQRHRFEGQMKAKAAGDEEAHAMDHDYVTALEYGLPPTGGLGIGIDRLVMFLTNSLSIRDVIAFPTMRPLKDD